MKKPKHLVISGLIGFAVFYLIASGCATFDFGGIESRAEGKFDKGAEIPLIQKINLNFSSPTRTEWFEDELKEVLSKRGYRLVEMADNPDVELQINYKILPKNKKTTVYLVFLIPSWQSTNVEGFEVKVIYRTSNGICERFYREECKYPIYYNISLDLKALEYKKGGKNGKEDL